MAGASYRNSLNADNAHLPTVSVFIVLLAMMAGLTTYVRPSTANFEAAKLSILENFAAERANEYLTRRVLPDDLVTELEDVCARYSASCRPTDSAAREGMAVLFSPTRFDPAVAGLSSSENRFLQDVSGALRGTDTQVSLLLPQTRPIDSANVAILLDLIGRTAGTDLKIAVVHAPALQTVSQFGFLIEPIAIKL